MPEVLVGCGEAERAVVAGDGMWIGGIVCGDAVPGGRVG